MCADMFVVNDMFVGIILSIYLLNYNTRVIIKLTSLIVCLFERANLRNCWFELKKSFCVG